MLICLDSRTAVLGGVLITAVLEKRLTGLAGGWNQVLYAAWIAALRACVDSGDVINLALGCHRQPSGRAGRRYCCVPPLTLLVGDPLGFTERALRLSESEHADLRRPALLVGRRPLPFELVHSRWRSVLPLIAPIALVLVFQAWVGLVLAVAVQGPV